MALSPDQTDRLQRDLLVVQTCYQPATGVWVLMRDLTRWLKQQSKLKVAMAIFPKPDWPAFQRQQLEELNVPYLLSGIGDYRASYLKLMFSPKLRRWVEELDRRYHPRHIIVHSHNARNSGIYVPLKARARCGISVISTFHGMQGIEYDDPWPKRLLDRYLAQRMRRFGVHFTSVDCASLQMIYDLLAIPPTVFKVIPNGIEDRGLEGCPSLRNVQAPFTVGFVSSFDRNKGWDIVAAAVEQLANEGEAIRLLMAGGGPEAPQAAAWAASREYAQFLGYVPDAYDTLVPKLDCLALLTKKEGMPIVLLEAMACGVPILATSVNAIPEMISEGENGFLVERSVDAAVFYLRELIHDRARLMYMHRRSREIFKERFEIGSVGRQYLALYEELASTRSGI